MNHSKQVLLFYQSCPYIVLYIPVPRRCTHPMRAVNANNMSRCLILKSCHIQYFTVLYAALTCWLCPSSFRVHVCTRKDKRKERLVTVSSKLGYAVNTVESCFMVSVTNSWDQEEFSKNVT